MTNICSLVSSLAVLGPKRSSPQGKMSGFWLLKCSFSLLFTVNKMHQNFNGPEQFEKNVEIRLVIKGRKTFLTTHQKIDRGNVRQKMHDKICYLLQHFSSLQRDASLHLSLTIGLRSFHVGNLFFVPRTESSLRIIFQRALNSNYYMDTISHTTQVGISIYCCSSCQHARDAFYRVCNSFTGPR